VASRLPSGAKPALGPDATGVGWIYEYALTDKSGQYNLSQLRSLQDWFLKFELQTIEGVSEVATVGGMVKQYQVVLDIEALKAFNISLAQVKTAIQQGNQETGGSVIEMAEAEYMIRTNGYISKIEDLKHIPLGMTKNGTPILLKDIAQIRLGPQMRRGIAELDGEGEVVGGIIVMRSGENALTVIEKVKNKIDQLKSGLPEGVELIETYDRSSLILRAVDNLKGTLLEELAIVALVCIVFLFHLRSSLVAIISLPIGILMAFIVMQQQGINANIMSLGGIAIAIGAMVDAAIVMIENVHKHMEKTPVTDKNRWDIIYKASIEIGPALFFSLLIITLSFIPVFTLEAQEGRLFSPLAYTKTFAMASAAALSITLVPVLMGYFIRSHIIAEKKNPINRLLIFLYLPIIRLVLKVPKTIIFLSLITMASMYWPISQIGSEFMPDLDEGDLMYMPTTFPGLSIGKAQQLLQQTDKLIRTLPEVKRVFGKIGRADTATDPAPLTMIETTIQLHPRSQWREGMTLDKLKKELNQLIKFPGLTNAWVMPIKTRLDMLATGIKTPVGIKISGADLKVIETIGKEVEEVIKQVPGTLSAYSERVAGGRYITVDIKRQEAARFNLNIKAIQDVVRSAIGGMNISESVEGLERYPINIRYPRDSRDSLEKIKQIPMITPSGNRIVLEQVAQINVSNGPAMIKSENARPNGWIFVDIDNRDLGSYVSEAQKFVQDKVTLPAGYSLSWSGQYEYMVRAKQKMQLVVPVTLIVIILLLYLNFKSIPEVLIILGALPMSLVGGFWLLWYLQYNLSVAVWVGFIALAGVAAETGVVMLVFLLNSYKELQQQLGQQISLKELHSSIIEGAVNRVRPKIMTVSAIMAGLLPIMLSDGTGSEVMRRIAAPMLGGMVSATILTLVVIPALFYLWKKPSMKK